jgi:gas vesicle protein
MSDEFSAETKQRLKEQVSEHMAVIKEILAKYKHHISRKLEKELNDIELQE